MSNATVDVQRITEQIKADLAAFDRFTESINN